MRWDGAMVRWVVGLFQPYIPLRPNPQLRVETLKRRKGRTEVAKEEVKKSQTLTSPSTSHSKVLSSIAAALYDDDNNGASERSERAKL